MGEGGGWERFNFACFAGVFSFSDFFLFTQISGGWGPLSPSPRFATQFYEHFSKPKAVHKNVS